MSSDRIMAEEPIEKKITRILIHRKMTVTAAESCTGGLVAGTLVNADGISEVFKEVMLLTLMKLSISCLV
mgnify:CR=1 FL=1